MRIRGCVLSLAVALQVLAAQADAQNVPVTTLAKPDAEFPEGFTNLSVMRELPDGRVMVVEQCEQVIKLLDFRTGEVGVVSRTGSGPGEYRIPRTLFPIGDSTLVYDPGNRRYLVLGPDAKPGRMFDPLPIVRETPGQTVMIGLFTATASDARGRLYSRQSGIIAGPDGRMRADSVAVERWDIRSGKRDSVVFFRLVLPPGPLGQREQSMPFQTGTQWAVAADGRIALVHAKDYRVEFISPTGVRSPGRPNAFTPLRLSEGHKQQWRVDSRPVCGTGPRSITGADGKTSTITVMGPSEPTEWPETLTPFLPNSAAFAPDGMLWVKRTTPAGAPATFDLVNRVGQVVSRVVLARKSRLLGFGQGSVYVLRVDEDDLQFVQRFGLPKVGSR
jgi:hypothetical protein